VNNTEGKCNKAEDHQTPKPSGRGIGRNDKAKYSRQDEDYHVTIGVDFHVGAIFVV
jgi:hypothetical protein